ncbi:hypothetical protein GCM10009630_54840 [Kribbella jejuensis]|uniref:Uncharacterized protein n=1 Tax=Kribbella jejuensis TaxID=236068 RepID=A0A542EW87_9ACTN|nr:hypothetical protein [Kribbella jejuensis]TQJ19603.1 hypothetical protein FB475_3773 [Kribbella jejuensis]
MTDAPFESSRPYYESRTWPSMYGRWTYAALWRDESGAYNLTPVGPSVRSRDNVPRFDGDLRSIGQSRPDPATIFDRDTRPNPDVRPSDRMPEDTWVLAVMSENPGEVPHYRFTPCGPVRSGDPLPLVERLHLERAEGPLRAMDNGLGRTSLPDELAADGTTFTPRSAWERTGAQPSSRNWRYAAFWTDSSSETRGEVLRYTPLGEPQQTRDVRPVWDGGVRPVVPTPAGMEPLRQQAWSSDRLPSDEWVLGVVSETPGQIPPVTFAVAGDTRYGDPRPVVRALLHEATTARPAADTTIGLTGVARAADIARPATTPTATQDPTRKPSPAKDPRTPI